jgi:hypothetical protein
MSKLGNWLRPRTATVEELREQLEHAAKAYEDATVAVESAQQSFDDSGSDAAAKSLTAARDVARFAGEHRDRARRILDEAEAKRAVEERAALQAKHDALKAELDAPDKVDADLEEQEAGGYVAAFKVRAARWEHFQQRAAKRQQLQIMSHALGYPPPRSDRNELPHSIQVAKIIRDHLTGLPIGQARDLAFAVAHFLDPIGNRFG